MRDSTIIAIAVLILPGGAFAQSTPTPPTQGPLVLERIESGFVVAPDYKVTELDGDLAHLAGGYAGWLLERTLFAGGGIYSVANRADDFRLTYGGLLAGWTLFPESRIQFGARGLIGLGRATLGSDVEVLRFGDRGSRDPRSDRLSTRTPGEPTTVRVRARDEFLVFEPQLTIVTKLTNHIAVNIGAGYRVTAYADRLGDRVNGATGSIGVQLGGW
jgi:hypothetical protein